MDRPVGSGCGSGLYILTHSHMEIYRKNDRGHLWGHRFVQACAVEMHIDTSQPPFCMEI